MHSWTPHVVLYTSNRTETRDRLVANSPMSKDSRGQFPYSRCCSEPSLGADYLRMWLLCDQPLRQVPLVPACSLCLQWHHWTSQDVPCPSSGLFVQNLRAGGQDIWFGKASVSHGNLIHWHKAHVEHRVRCLAHSRGFQSLLSMQRDTPLGQTL